MLDSKLEACQAAIKQLEGAAGEAAVDAELARLRDSLSQLQFERDSLFRSKPKAADGAAEEDEVMQAREEVENPEGKAQRVMIETADGGWSLRFFQIKDGALSIFDSPNSSAPIAVRDHP